MDGDQYPDEWQYLVETVEFLDEEVRRRKSQPPATAAYKETAKEIQRVRDEFINRYQKVRSRPYFGRLDFLLEGSTDPIKAYIGTGHVGGSGRDFVYDWRAPFPGQLFYADPQRVRSYKAPKGEIRGSITRKRQYAIENAQLLEVTEVYRSLPSADGREAIEDSSESFMIEQLSRSRGSELREVVATIQPDQYQQIAAAPGQVMVVQGVAGSGKSIVELHRIAYLLSPLNVGSERITASRVIIFGPTRTFLRYVANLLPSIDVRQVVQRTVRDWLLGTLSQRVYLDRGEPLLEKLLKHKGKEWEAAYQAAKLKGSLRMSRTLERHVQTHRRQFVAAATALAVQLDSATPIVLDPTRARRVVRSVPSGPLNTQRERVIDRLVEALWEAYGRQNSAAETGVPRKTRREFVEQVRPQVGVASGDVLARAGLPPGIPTIAVRRDRPSGGVKQSYG